MFSPGPSPPGTSSVFSRRSLWGRFSHRSSASSSTTSDEPRYSAKLHKREAQIYKQRSPNGIITVMHFQGNRSNINDKQSSAESSRATTPSSTAASKVDSSGMRTIPFPSSSGVHTVPWKIFLTPDQVHSLFNGSSPRHHEDKWFIFAQGPDSLGKMKVHFHRSWTGIKVAELFVIVDLKGEGAGTIVGIKYNGTYQTKGMDEDQAKALVTATCYWVLGVDWEKPVLPPLKFD